MTQLTRDALWLFVGLPLLIVLPLWLILLLVDADVCLTLLCIGVGASWGRELGQFAEKYKSELDR